MITAEAQKKQYIFSWDKVHLFKCSACHVALCTECKKTLIHCVISWYLIDCWFHYIANEEKYQVSCIMLRLQIIIIVGMVSIGTCVLGPSVAVKVHILWHSFMSTVGGQMSDFGLFWTLLLHTFSNLTCHTYSVYVFKCKWSCNKNARKHKRLYINLA